MIEQEIKFMLTYGQYRQMREQFKREYRDRKELFQINYYYDTPGWQIFTAGNTLRIRRKAGAYRLEYKHHKQIDGDIRTCEELTRRMSEAPYEMTADQLRKMRLPIDFDVCHVGCLTTGRTDFYTDGCVVSLDENHYLGVVDYELEIEGSRRAISAVISRCGIVGEANRHGKYSRFVTAAKDRTI